MAVIPASKKGKTEKLTRAGEIQISAEWCFRLQDVSFEAAIAGEEGACFFKRLDMKPAKTDRVTACSLDGKIIREFDTDHLVIAHHLDHLVGEAETV